jgi:FSR family fosmidomycin resistance protein-like MFS transporter
MVSAVAGQFLFGVILALLGTLFGIRAATDALALDVSRQTVLLVVLFAGQLICTALAGRIVDRFGGMHVLAAGAGAMASGLACLGLAHSFPVVLAAVVVMSAGGSAVNAATNVLVSTVSGARRGQMLNVVGIFTALGALMLPLVLAGTSSMDALRSRLLVLAGAAGVSAIVHAAAREPARPAHPAGHVSAWRLLRDNRVRLLTLMLALDFGSEAVVCGWIATYTLGTVPDAPATAMVAVYWGALMTGRAVWPSVLSRVAKLPVVGIASLCVAVACVGISQAYSTATLSIAVAFAGFTLSPLAPTLLSVAGDCFPRQTGTVFGLLLALGQIGSVALPWIVGRMAIDTGFRPAMFVPAVAAALVAVATLWMRAYGTVERSNQMAALEAS